MDTIPDRIIFAHAGVASYCVGARGIHVTVVTSGCTFIHICGNKHLFNGSVIDPFYTEEVIIRLGRTWGKQRLVRLVMRVVVRLV